ncbi:phosphonate C-P lyase system protein PhnG [Citrobacter amalonaticus]|uniref:Phosphonate C-P lyase system protein PhnG n=1 Tax=Citrobacter amalonaticus TaxID=35703 RepID=A0A2S4RU01_CITAM|nr:phosphonate C-P lyase system protein PhnG [Citrobacter amalonaticus]POT57093.1 phosphonate C-P lyase system protein PhnG [Citrobacter amalonaticus]POT72618.1 phosphonate C-P lyase system protein PhnG [Citrobacter amalonaticus]POU63473.1 phosphonate C-P lyase system protein PhnG [Citrobacter amalonaticus]POV03237.1 phosphonate C-P lyase system protein PhnG [Citrobacter amalonaticus]
MHVDIATRQRWMRALAYSSAEALNGRLQALKLSVEYALIRAPETGLMQIQARMGGTGNRFFAGDTTLTRAVVRLKSGTLGYSYLLGRNKQHAEQCAVIDALLQEHTHFQNLMETLITPLEAERDALMSARRAEVNASRVDFFTLVRGDNA